MTRGEKLEALRAELEKAEKYKEDARRQAAPTAEAFADGRIHALRYAIGIVGL